VAEEVQQVFPDFIRALAVVDRVTKFRTSGQAFGVMTKLRAHFPHHHVFALIFQGILQML